MADNGNKLNKTNMGKQKGYFTEENKGKTVSLRKTGVPHRLTIAHEGVNFYHLGKPYGVKCKIGEVVLVSKEQYYLTPKAENIDFIIESI